MPPLVKEFPASELPNHINKLPTGKTRKPKISDLKTCELKELIQYNCNLVGPQEDPKSRVVCQPILRLFRQCTNGLTVETTEWPGEGESESTTKHEVRFKADT